MKCLWLNSTEQRRNALTSVGTGQPTSLSLRQQTVNLRTAIPEATGVIGKGILKNKLFAQKNPTLRCAQCFDAVGLTTRHPPDK